MHWLEVLKCSLLLQNNKKSVAAGLGLGLASLMVAQKAEAATELMQLADSDNRFSAIALLFLPVLGWVGFNIAQVCSESFS